MKVAAHQVAGVLNNVSDLCAILLYGDDWGLIRDRAALATQAVLGAATDPFRFSVLTREEHGRLGDEVRSMPLGGGRRVIRVQDATDGLGVVLEKLGDHRRDALVVLEAAGLTPRSKLRALAEKQPHWAAIACHPERSTAVAAEVSRQLKAAALVAEPDALAYLAVELAGESVRRRAELEKLVLYASGCERVTLTMAQECCSTALDASLGAAVSAALGGRVRPCDALLDELWREGATGPGLLAVLANQVHRLLRVRVQLDQGRSPEDAMRVLQPPVYPSQAQGLLQELSRWSAEALEALGRATREADLACKRAGSADFAIAGRLLGTVARRGRPAG